MPVNIETIKVTAKIANNDIFVFGKAVLPLGFAEMVSGVNGIHNPLTFRSEMLGLRDPLNSRWIKSSRALHFFLLENLVYLQIHHGSELVFLMMFHVDFNH